MKSMIRIENATRIKVWASYHVLTVCLVYQLQFQLEHFKIFITRKSHFSNINNLKFAFIETDIVIFTSSVQNYDIIYLQYLNFPIILSMCHFRPLLNNFLIITNSFDNFCR